MGSSWTYPSAFVSLLAVILTACCCNSDPNTLRHGYGYHPRFCMVRAPPMQMAARASPAPPSRGPKKGFGFGSSSSSRRWKGQPGDEQYEPFEEMELLEAGRKGLTRAGRGPRANSFSSRGKANKHAKKFSAVSLELGLLTMSEKLIKRHEKLEERYSHFRAVQEARGTRQRGAKRAATYHALSTYSLHFLKLLEEEVLHEEAEVMHRLKYWTKARLQEEGLALMGVVARFRGRLFKEYIIRFTLPPRGSRATTNPSFMGPRAPLLPYHRLGPGDIISIAPEKQNPLSSPNTIEGVVLERGPFYVDVVVKEIPSGISRRSDNPTNGERFRLDVFLNRISFQRMVAAVHQVTGMETGYTVSTEIRDILIKSFAEWCQNHIGSPILGGGNGGSGVGGGGRSFTSPYLKSAKSLTSNDDGPKSKWEEMASRAVGRSWIAKKEADRVVTKEVEQFSLNLSQEKALRTALSRKLSLIQGPPGTGKTRTACHLINIAVQLNQKRDVGKVLAVAFSNVAADNLLEGCLRLGLKAVRVGRAATVRPELRNHTLDALISEHESVETFKTRLEDARGRSARELYAARRDLEDAELLAVINILANADVVVSTCVGAANDLIMQAVGATAGGGPIRSLKFPTVIVDEASQATEPATLVPLTQGCEQLVLVGDHHQLPPTIKSRKAAARGLGVSLFSRLAMAGIRPSLLTLQYRMHPVIAHFPSRRFYGGLLKSQPRSRDRPKVSGFQWPNKAVPVAFVDIGSMKDEYFEHRTSGNQTSYMNHKEAQAVVRVLEGFLRKGDVAAKDIGVVTPYSAQVRLLTEMAHQRLRYLSSTKQSGAGTKKKQSWMDIEIQSVDSYQGREKELILISAVRSNPMGRVGFLADWRRLNVAITRAKRGIVVFGDQRTLVNDRHWGAYLRWCSDNRVMTSLQAAYLDDDEYEEDSDVDVDGEEGGEAVEVRAQVVGEEGQE